MKPAGWYLGLRYMQGLGLVARAAEPISACYGGAQFIFADRVLLNVPSIGNANVLPPLRGRLGGGWLNKCGIEINGESPPQAPPVKGGRHSSSSWRDTLKNWWSALAVGGHLILWLPDCRYHALEKSEARLTLEDVSHALDDVPGWQLRESDLIDGHIYAVFQKRGDGKKFRTPWRKQPKHILIARTGAHGDALMAASILPWLKDQGHAVSFITKRAGVETLRHDPHIDELIWLADGQVADEELPYYWRAWEKRYDRFINLTFSVEGELLKQPARPDYYWPEEQRRKQCARSYLRHTHELAGVPGPYRVCFYPDEAEKDWAAERAAQYGKFVLWCLRGSAPHKWWPFGPQAICRLLANSDLNFVLSGDDEARPLADEIMRAARDYYGDTSRIHDLTGSHSIREMMALAHHASAVVGPETGVMNAVSMQPVPKILFLSHSAPVNLSGDWVAATALQPVSPCYPCHRLHYTHEWCPQDEATGAAACAASIPIERVTEAIIAAAKQAPQSPWWLRGARFSSAA